MNLIRTSISMLTARSLLLRSQYSFSEYFRQKDFNDLTAYNYRKTRNEKYHSMVALWKRPLQKKRLRQARIKQIKSNLPQPQPSSQKLVVHNQAMGIKKPAPDSIFAVIKVDSRQYKVTKDCMIILDAKPTHQINQNIKFEEVLLVGTQTYTSIGRPVLKSVTVEGNIQSISDSDKILVFKKKRRKQYRRSFGSRLPLTTVRITNIVHNLTSEILSKAVPLQ